MLVTNADLAWTNEVPSLLPGSHVAVFADTQPDLVGLTGRLAGLELRDTLLVVRSGPTVGLVLLFRKPVEATVAEQVWTTGTGGLNLGACRVETSETITTHSRGHSMAHPALPGEKHVLPGRKGMDVIEPNERHGRWPPNVLLVHGPGCCLAGSKKVIASNAPGRASRGEGERAIGFGKSEGTARVMPFYTDPDDYGMETVAAWECEDGCPARMLDEQSGDRPVSGSAASGKPTNRAATDRAATDAGFNRGGSGGASGRLPNDAGGASRFFPQFRDESELQAWVARLIGQSTSFDSSSMWTGV